MKMPLPSESGKDGQTGNRVVAVKFQMALKLLLVQDCISAIHLLHYCSQEVIKITIF